MDFNQGGRRDLLGTHINLEIGTKNSKVFYFGLTE